MVGNPPAPGGKITSFVSMSSARRRPSMVRISLSLNTFRCPMYSTSAYCFFASGSLPSLTNTSPRVAAYSGSGITPMAF
jgi:hypothetical protein